MAEKVRAGIAELNARIHQLFAVAHAEITDAAAELEAARTNEASLRYRVQRARRHYVGSVAANDVHTNMLQLTVTNLDLIQNYQEAAVTSAWAEDEYAELYRCWQEQFDMFLRDRRIRVSAPLSSRRGLGIRQSPQDPFVYGGDYGFRVLAAEGWYSGIELEPLVLYVRVGTSEVAAPLFEPGRMGKPFAAASVLPFSAE